MAAAARTALTASPATPFSRLRLPGQIRGTCGFEDGGALRSPGASIHLGIIRLKIQANRWAIGRSMEEDGPRYSSAGGLQSRCLPGGRFLTIVGLALGGVGIVPVAFFACCSAGAGRPWESCSFSVPCSLAGTPSLNA
jgi:hypothetical protein